jgi:sulfur carrier protein|tara:strand:+ start:2690 stop:2890 length:201 start_codon:yes stop_codon:yes gene_type:complete
MNIILNNDEQVVLENISVSELLEKFKINLEYMAVEVNQTIVPKSKYDNFRLKENDKVEIISAVGGG